MLENASKSKPNYELSINLEIDKIVLTVICYTELIDFEESIIFSPLDCDHEMILQNKINYLKAYISNITNKYEHIITEQENKIKSYGDLQVKKEIIEEQHVQNITQIKELESYLINKKKELDTRESTLDEKFQLVERKKLIEQQEAELQFKIKIFEQKILNNLLPKIAEITTYSGFIGECSRHQSVTFEPDEYVIYYDSNNSNYNKYGISGTSSDGAYIILITNRGKTFIKYNDDIREWNRYQYKYVDFNVCSMNKQILKGIVCSMIPTGCTQSPFRSIRI